MIDRIEFPSRDAAPMPRRWLPARPACGATNIGCADRAIRFSLKSDDGLRHFFVLTRTDALWLARTFIFALAPRIARALFATGKLYSCRPHSHSLRSSGILSRDGSPHEGQAQ